MQMTLRLSFTMDHIVMLFVIIYCLLLPVLAIDFKIQKRVRDAMFRDEQIIHRSNHIITNLLAPVDCSTYAHLEITEIRTIFFTASSKYKQNSTIYALERYIPYEIMPGGRDTTSDYGPDSSIYFGGVNGLYKYDPDTLSARRYGTVVADIIQLQKANHSDTIYILTSKHKLYAVTKEGRSKKLISAATCATQFVLDTSDNIYFIECKTSRLYVLEAGLKKTKVNLPSTALMKNGRLVRPAFVMKDSVPYFEDGHFYVIFNNGTTVKKEFVLDEKPSAFSIDSSLYFVTAIDGNIYELNIIELLMKAIFKKDAERLTEFSKMILTELDNFKGWYV